jgi:hypothetical protein
LRLFGVVVRQDLPAQLLEGVDEFGALGIQQLQVQECLLQALLLQEPVGDQLLRYLKADPKDVDLVPGFTRDVTGLVSDQRSCSTRAWPASSLSASASPFSRCSRTAGERYSSSEMPGWFSPAPTI